MWLSNKKQVTKDINIQISVEKGLKVRTKKI